MDAAIVTPGIDANVADTPDAMLGVADAKPGAADAKPPVDAMTCANISLTVIDDNTANDILKIRVDDADIHICDGDAVQVGMNSVTQCDFCVEIGTAVKLSWFVGQDRITEFTTDCQSPCPIQNEVSCDFTVTVACSATATFDIN